MKYFSMLMGVFLGTSIQTTIPKEAIFFSENQCEMYRYPFLQCLSLARRNASDSKAIKAGMAQMFLNGKNVRDEEMCRSIMSMKADFSEIDPEMGTIIECAFKIDEILYLQKERYEDYWSKLSQEEREDHTQELCTCLITLSKFANN